MTDKGKRKDEDLVKQATKPIPVMTEDESIASTARDFNVTSGQQRSAQESDTEIDTGTDDIGAVKSRRGKSRSGSRSKSRSSSGREEESDIARSDADTPALLTDESEGTSAASGSEREETSESRGTSSRSRTRSPSED